ncbi:MAG: hypothetical protein DRP63_05835, partial [Planctomycetota bacterium]
MRWVQLLSAAILILGCTSTMIPSQTEKKPAAADTAKPRSTALRKEAEQKHPVERKQPIVADQKKRTVLEELKERVKEQMGLLASEDGAVRISAREKIERIIRFCFTKPWLIDEIGSVMREWMRSTKDLQVRNSLEQILRKYEEYLGWGLTEDVVKRFPDALERLSDLRTRKEMLHKLAGWRKDATVVKAFIRALRDRREQVRRLAARTLGLIGDKRAAPSLIEALKDRNRSWGERATLAWALGTIGDRRAVMPLIAASKEGGNMRAAAADALGEIGDKRAVQPLLRALQDKEWWIGATAARALGKIGDKRAVEPLIKVIKHKAMWMRAAAAEALGRIGDKRAVAPLIDALKDKQRRVRAAAARALGRLADKRAIKPLLRALNDKDALVRALAARSLGRIGDKSVVQPLISALKD